jgi:hypothetical protein
MRYCSDKLYDALHDPEGNNGISFVLTDEVLSTVPTDSSCHQ